jgi:hypothetical protein
MKQSYQKDLFPGSAIVRKYTFKTVLDTRDHSALLARANHQMSQAFAAPRGKSAILSDCFECLSPHEIAA